jgi:hypothetical protein
MKNVSSKVRVFMFCWSIGLIGELLLLMSGRENVYCKGSNNEVYGSCECISNIYIYIYIYIYDLLMP